MAKDNITFHHHIAAELTARYGTDERAPVGWRETLAWHWEQAGAFAKAADVALEIAETRMTHLDFTIALQWAERTLTLLERLDPLDLRTYELRAYTLTLAVLEFGGQYREGLDYARRMLRVAQTQNNHEAEARAHLAIGRMQRELSQFSLAELSLHAARELAQRAELDELETEVHIHLAKVHQLQGQHLEALQELQLAREEQELHSDKSRLSRVFTGIGDVYRVLGAVREALSFYTRALNLEQSSGSIRGQAILKDKIALALLAQGKLQDALAHEEESLRLRENLKDIVGQARSYSVLGMIQNRLGNYEQAQRYHTQAREIEEQTQSHLGQRIALMHLGDTASAMHNYEQAREYYLGALALVQHDKDQIALARIFERIGDVSNEEGQSVHAKTSWQKALKIREALHHVDEATKLRVQIARLERM